ncbi:hypothetical protein U0035_08155 [Niabella yanshanensis]|uniref:Lipoprotein n=1 Tax=Niabella yanshanensis TaxID=577386 RepID=A0ABZ0WAA2_9BACT|nr:hypothetical protein [Niabella yanshanensis]WQD40116.1 hypothetical protein U0035_08155 [Niabella yanshanensis]
MKLYTLAGFTALLTALSFISCSSGNKIQVNEYARLVSCHQANNVPVQSPGLRPLHELTTDSILLGKYSFRSLNIAYAFGFLPLLLQYEKLQSNQPSIETDMDRRLKKIEIALQLSERIDLASLEISSFASELDCEEERITQVADFLKGKEKQRETRLTVSAIGVGAIGGVASGILSTRSDAGNSGDYLGIATGITEAILGVLILRNSKKTELLHPRNALKDIWFGQAVSDIFPPAVWYYLKYKNPNQPEELSLRERIIERWKSFNQVDPKALNQFETLYLKDKGIYDTEALYNRAKMYDQVESYVKMIKQDLTTLSYELALQNHAK